MLYLLTAADSISTGPMAWSEWTAALLRDFFLKVLSVLDKGELASAEAVAIVDQKKNEIIAPAGTKKAKSHIKELLKVMSPRYLLYMPACEMTAHIKLYDRLGVPIHTRQCILAFVNVDALAPMNNPSARV